jgi:hypothetical protein
LAGAALRMEHVCDTPVNHYTSSLPLTGLQLSVKAGLQDKSLLQVPCALPSTDHHSLTWTPSAATLDATSAVVAACLPSTPFPAPVAVASTVCTPLTYASVPLLLTVAVLE